MMMMMMMMMMINLLKKNLPYISSRLVLVVAVAV